MPAGHSLKSQLESLLLRFPPANRVHTDPLLFPRRYFEMGRSRQEVEAVGLLAAMLAYGAVPLFTRVIGWIIDETDGRFLDGIAPPAFCCFSHGYRLSTAEDISRFCRAVGRVIKKSGGIWEAFSEGWRLEQTVRAGLTSLNSALASELDYSSFQAAPHGLRHLLPNPAGGGCVKRWHMFLRWMVRPDDGADLGLWPEVPSSALLMPIDRHISRIARNLGLTSRKSDDWKTAEEITAALRRFDPKDPVKYDFALCHLGIDGECTHGRDKHLCSACTLSDHCLKGSNE